MLTTRRHAALHIAALAIWGASGKALAADTPPKSATTTPEPTAKDSPAAVPPTTSAPSRPQQPPQMPRPAETVSPSRKLSMPNDM